MDTDGKTDGQTVGGFWMVLEPQLESLLVIFLPGGPTTALAAAPGLWPGGLPRLGPATRATRGVLNGVGKIKTKLPRTGTWDLLRSGSIAICRCEDLDDLVAFAVAFVDVALVV